MKLAMEFTTLLDLSVSKMMYKLVPPEDHRRNLDKKLIGTFKDHFIGVLSGCNKNMPMHLWCQHYRRWNSNYSSYDSHESTQACLHMHMCTKDNKTITSTHLCQSGWNCYCTSSRTSNKFMHSIATRDTSLARCLSATNAKRSGCRTRTPHKYQGQYGSSTNI
jgi:hypothetical protein